MKFLLVDPVEQANRYLQGRADPSDRYASWDHCYNYFRRAHDEKRLATLANGDALQISCLQLGFYLASWGMYRGRASLRLKSARALAPVVLEIVAAPPTMWTLDVEGYDETSMSELLETSEKLRAAFPGRATDTLITKTMLGVFGNVPAFDRYFRKGFDTYRLNRSSLQKIKMYFDWHKQDIELLQVATIDFDGSPTGCLYSQAKVIDMIFFASGGGLGGD